MNAGIARPLARFWADFAEVDARDQVWVALDEPELWLDSLDKGDTLELFDYEGNRCLAFIVQMEGVGAVCQLLVQTWTYSPEPDLPTRHPVSMGSYVQLDKQLQLIA